MTSIALEADSGAQQLRQLLAERSSYLRRIAELQRAPERKRERDGYRKLVGQIETACTALAAFGKH